MNTDDVVAITDWATDALLLVFNTPPGKQALADAGLPADLIESLSNLGLSAIANLLASIQVARRHDYGPDHVILSVATDGAEMYRSEVERIGRRDHPQGYDRDAARRALDRYLREGETGEIEVLNEAGRRRIFNLGYYTWVEQQGVSLADFEARRQPGFWVGLRGYLDRWDQMISEFNERTGAGR
jgi:hypothetical protein